jgi:hypothetical protein
MGRIPRRTDEAFGLHPERDEGDQVHHPRSRRNTSRIHSEGSGRGELASPMGR